MRVLRQILVATVVFRLNVGPKFSGSWVISGIELPKGKNFCNLSVFFNGEVWTTPLTKLKELVKKFGGELVDDCAKAQLVVNSDGTLLLESANQLSIHESILHRLSPFSPEIKTKKKPASRTYKTNHQHQIKTNKLFQDQNQIQKPITRTNNKHQHNKNKNIQT
jgi:hypothetical protein